MGILSYRTLLNWPLGTNRRRSALACCAPGRGEEEGLRSGTFYINSGIYNRFPRKLFIGMQGIAVIKGAVFIGCAIVKNLFCQI